MGKGGAVWVGLVSRPATAADILAVHPDQTCSWRAWAVDLDGKLAGVIGIALMRPMACLFCWFDEALRPYLKSLTVLRLLKKVEEVVKASRVPVLAIRDRKEPKAPHILKRLGFVFDHVSDEGDPIYKWGRS